MTARFVEGVPNDPEALEQIRQDLSEHRAESMKVWPEGITYSVLMTHVIAHLGELKAYKEAGIELPPPPPEPPVRRAAPPVRE